MTWLMKHWSLAALALALGASAFLGYRWRGAAIANAAWQARYDSTVAHGDTLEHELTGAEQESARKGASLDTALANWHRVAQELTGVSHETPHQVAPVSTKNSVLQQPSHPDTALAALDAAAQRDSAVAIGNELARAVEEFQAAADRAEALSEETIDTLHARIDLLEHAPAPPKLEYWAAGGYDLNGGAAARVGATFHVSRSWAVDADITRRLATSDTTRLALWVRHIF